MESQTWRYLVSGCEVILAPWVWAGSVHRMVPMCSLRRPISCIIDTCCAWRCSTWCPCTTCSQATYGIWTRQLSSCFHIQMWVGQRKAGTSEHVSHLLGLMSPSACVSAIGPVSQSCRRWYMMEVQSEACRQDMTLVRQHSRLRIAAVQAHCCPWWASRKGMSGDHDHTVDSCHVFACHSAEGSCCVADYIDIPSALLVYVMSCYFSACYPLLDWSDGQCLVYPIGLHLGTVAPCGLGQLGTKHDLKDVCIFRSIFLWLGIRRRSCIEPVAMLLLLQPFFSSPSSRWYPLFHYFTYLTYS